MLKFRHGSQSCESLNKTENANGTRERVYSESPMLPERNPPTTDNPRTPHPRKHLTSTTASLAKTPGSCGSLTGPGIAREVSPSRNSPFLMSKAERTNYSSASPVKTPTLRKNSLIQDGRSPSLASSAPLIENTLSPNVNQMKFPHMVRGPASPRHLKSSVISGLLSPDVGAKLTGIAGVNCSTPKITVFTTDTSGNQENIYSTPCNDDTHKEPTYQSLSQTTDLNGDGSFVDENGNSLVSMNDTRAERKCLTRDENDMSRSKANLDYLQFLTPNKFLMPLDRSSFCRTPSKYLDETPITWQEMTRNMLCLLSLMMNVESLIHMPLYLARWKGEGIIIYLVMLFIIGLPTVIMEILVGFVEKASSIKVWSYMIPLMSGIGPAMATASIFLAAKTCAIMCYSMVYLVNSLRTPLPWTTCEKWWGADSKCFSTAEIEHLELNRSVLCILYDLAGEDCHSHNIPSHVQFWENHVLQIDPHGLRVLGHLGNPNLQLLLFSACLWVLVGLCTLPNKLHRSRIISCSTIIVLMIITTTVLWNIVEHSAFYRLRDYITIENSSTWSNVNCYLEAFWLVVTGLSIFNGSLVSCAASFKKIQNIKLISATCILVHILFLVLAALTILPLLPANLDAREMLEKKEIGYFPLALISLEIEPKLELSVLSFLIYLLVIITGFNLIMGLVGSIQMLRRYVITRLEKMYISVGVGSLGFLMSLPLIYQAGPSVLPLYYIYGYKVPIHVLAACLCLAVFWLFGSRRLAVTMPGSLGNLLLSAIWLVNPIALTAIGGLYLSIGLAVPEPVPLPSWAINLGIFLAVVSTSQVLVGMCVSVIHCFKDGKPLLAREQLKVQTFVESRTIAELCEMKESAHSNTYKSFDDILLTAEKLSKDQ